MECLLWKAWSLEFIELTESLKLNIGHVIQVHPISIFWVPTMCRAL